jgi:hypothetical protein
MEILRSAQHPQRLFSDPDLQSHDPPQLPQRCTLSAGRLALDGTVVTGGQDGQDCQDGANDRFIDAMRLLAIPIFLRDGPGLVVHSGIDLGGFSPLMQEIVSDGIFETVLENGLTDVRTARA